MRTHDRQRRKLLTRGASWAIATGLGTAVSEAARASAEGLPDARAVQATQQSLHALGRMEPGRITLRAPEVSENGAYVPVSIDSALPGTTEMSIFVDTNPVPLAARFEIPPGTDAFASMRVKVAQSGRIYAVVHANGQTYWSFVETQVVVGGCG